MREKSSPSEQSQATPPGAGTPGKPPGEEHMVTVFMRQSASIGDKSYLAGQIVAVPESDQLWEAVNKGYCDLRPPPGVAGQPFPPESVTQAEAPEPALPPGVVVTMTHGEVEQRQKAQAAKEKKGKE